MRQTISMHTTWSNGTSECKHLPKTECRAALRDLMNGTVPVDGPASAARAMHDIMDEQTVAFTYQAVVIAFELDPIFA